MKAQQIRSLVEQYLAGTLDENGRQQFESLLLQDGHKKMISAVIAEQMYKEAPRLPEEPDEFYRIPERIVRMDKQASPAAPVKRLPVTKWVRIAAAAAIASVILLGAKYGWHPGNLSATRQATAMHMRTISTRRGQRPSSVTLPDGSRICLNAGSTITYDSLFSNRSVALTGEAFFDVVPESNHPFSVRSGTLTTTVLGTSFTVHAYPDEQVSIAVKTGKVQVQSSGTLPVVITPGKQFVENHDALQSVDTASITAWTNGKLMYTDKTLQEIVNDLERVFDTTIRIGNPALQQTRITIAVDRSIGLRATLELTTRITDSKWSEDKGIYFIH